jgi:hypothetical protein
MKPLELIILFTLILFGMTCFALVGIAAFS